MGNNEYKKFGKNQFHYDSNGNMVDNQTGKRYIQSATNGQDVVIFGMPKMQIVNNNDAIAVSKQPIVRSLDRGEVAARLNAERKQHRQQVGAAQDDAEQAKAYFDKSMKEATQPTIYGKTADAIHNIANLGVGVAYMSGNPIAIAAASGYAIPSTLKRWFTEGMDSNEMLANVTPVGEVPFNNPFTKRQIQQMLKGPKDMRISYKYLTPEDISKEAKYLASSEANVTHPYTVRFLNENHEVADNLGKVSNRLRYLDTGQGFQPSAMTNAQAMTLLPQNDKAITITAGYSGMGPANTVHKGTNSMGNYDFYTQNFLGAMNYSAFQPEALAEIKKDLNPDQIEYLNRQLDTIRRIHEKYGVKEFDKRSTSWTRFKPDQDHAGHRSYFKTDNYGMATGKISPFGEKYDPVDIIDLVNANKAVGEFLGGGNTQIGGLGQVFHFGEPLRISASKNRGFKDPESTFTAAYPNKILKEKLINEWGKDLTFKGPLNKMEQNISKISNRNPLVITGVYDPIWMDTQAVPANSLIRTRKNGGTIKYNRL